MALHRTYPTMKQTRTSEESFAILHALQAEKYDDEKDRAEWKAATTPEEKTAIAKRRSDWRTEQDKKIDEAIKNLVPVVGTPCTICYYTDRRAATVSRIISPCKIAVKHNEVKCIDYYSGIYHILPELGEGEDIFNKRSNGKWIMEGHKSNDGVRLCLHFQNHFIDPEF